ncbi:MAG: hypothetical protein J2P17_27395, partial [Mycobacterium sp.]|nr:hypothetical protein [Mycobacterium sp.]
GGTLSRRGQAFAATQTPDLTADVRIFESTTTHNSYPDDCDLRLDRLYIAEDLELSIEVQFSRALSDEESQEVQWSISNDDAVWTSGDFAGQPNPAVVTTTLSPARVGDPTQAVVHILYLGTDIAPPAPLRLVTNDEYAAALTSLASFTAVDGQRQLPLTVDLLTRFLGQDSHLTGTPSVGVTQLDICNPRLTQRAGANWGSDTVTDVPLVQYAEDQPAAEIVAEAAARALLAQNADGIRQFFVDNPTATTYAGSYTYTGNLTLNRPLDAALALHGVQFDGAWSATIDVPGGADAPLSARDVLVEGTVSDLYDFNLEDTGAGALPAAEAAKVQIASVKHDIGKVFVVTFALRSAFDSIDDL